MEALMDLGDMKGPVSLEIAAEIHGWQLQHHFGHGPGPAHPLDYLANLAMQQPPRPSLHPRQGFGTTLLLEGWSRAPQLGQDMMEVQDQRGATQLFCRPGARRCSSWTAALMTPALAFTRLAHSGLNSRCSPDGAGTPLGEAGGGSKPKRRLEDQVQARHTEACTGNNFSALLTPT